MPQHYNYWTLRWSSSSSCINCLNSCWSIWVGYSPLCLSRDSTPTPTGDRHYPSPKSRAWRAGVVLGVYLAPSSFVILCRPAARCCREGCVTSARAGAFLGSSGKMGRRLRGEWDTYFFLFINGSIEHVSSDLSISACAVLVFFAGRFVDVAAPVPFTQRREVRLCASAVKREKIVHMPGCAAFPRECTATTMSISVNLPQPWPMCAFLLLMVAPIAQEITVGDAARPHPLYTVWSFRLIRVLCLQILVSVLLVLIVSMFTVPFVRAIKILNEPLETCYHPAWPACVLLVPFTNTMTGSSNRSVVFMEWLSIHVPSSAYSLFIHSEGF